MIDQSQVLITLPDGVFMEGHFKTKHSLKIESSINGTLLSKQKVILESNSVFNGDLICSELVLSGKFSGNIFCTGKVQVKQGCQISGRVYTYRFENDEMTNLDCIISVPDTNTINRIKEIIDGIDVDQKLSSDSNLPSLIKIYEDNLAAKEKVKLPELVKEQAKPIPIPSGIPTGATNGVHTNGVSK